AVTIPFLIWTALSQTFWNPRRSGANTRSRIQFLPAPSLARIVFHALTAIFLSRIATRHRMAKNRCHGRTTYFLIHDKAARSYDRMLFHTATARSRHLAATNQTSRTRVARGL